VSRRPAGAAIATVAALVITTSLSLPGLPAAIAPGDAVAADCVWHRHTKRIVKKVRRHGRVRRVVRIVHWWTCDPVPPARLGVQAFEFYFVLSRPSVAAGELVLELNNRGEDPHNLNLARLDSPGAIVELPETESLQRSERRFRVQAGTYRLWCSLPLHAESGMETTLLVTPR